jgi:hypothetical protein
LPDYRALDREMRRDFVADLDEGDRSTGARALAFFDGWMRAHALYHDDSNYRSALATYLRAARTAPEIARSPLIRSRVRLAVAKSALASLAPSAGLADRARRLNASLRRRAGRYPELRPERDDTHSEGST